MGKTKDVALVLSSGGPRGFAYIGAIEELVRRGYNITSVAGTSIGSLVGGLYAAGGLDAFKEWLFALDNFKVMSLLDVSFSNRYLVKGEKLINCLKEIVPDKKIEELPIPFTAVAADLYTGEEVVFTEGDLFTAIRSSISIPSLLRPVKYKHRTLVDGGIVNTFPINRVKRNGHDILVGFDVNDIDAKNINSFLLGEIQMAEDSAQQRKDSLEKINKTYKDRNMSMIDKVRVIGGQGEHLIKRRLASRKKAQVPVAEGDDNYYTIISRSFSVANHALAKKAIEMQHPDVLVQMTLDSYCGVADYSKGPEIAEKGRQLMAAALDRYEKGE